MQTEQGIINAVKQRDKTYSVALNKQWFGGYGNCPVQKGDYVLLDYEDNGKYKNIVTIKTAETTKKEPERRSDTVTDDIHLQVCLKAAASILSGTSVTTDELVSYTKELRNKLWGDL